MTVLFDMIDVAHLEAFDYDRLRREKRHAELELSTARYWEIPDDIGYWEQYLEVVTVAISRKRYDDKKRYPLGNNHRISAADVKERLDIVNIIEQTTELRKTGNRFTGKCPLHNDRSPSLTVYPDQRSWWCYSCNRGGDIFDFIQAYDNVSFPKALNKLAGER